MDSPDCLLSFLSILVFYFLVFLFFLHFLVVGSVRQIELTHVGFRAHVKIAYRIVSYAMAMYDTSLVRVDQTNDIFFAKTVFHCAVPQ